MQIQEVSDANEVIKAGLLADKDAHEIYKEARELDSIDHLPDWLLVAHIKRCTLTQLSNTEVKNGVRK